MEQVCGVYFEKDHRESSQCTLVYGHRGRHEAWDAGKMVAVWGRPYSEPFSIPEVYKPVAEPQPDVMVQDVTEAVKSMTTEDLFPVAEQENAAAMTQEFCQCAYPYLGAQPAGTPTRCERCRKLVAALPEATVSEGNSPETWDRPDLDYPRPEGKGIRADREREADAQTGNPWYPSEAAQPQPAGTETISKEIRSVSEFTGLTEDQTLRFVGCLLRVGLEIFPSAKLAALQRSHDELLRLAEMAKSSSSMGLRDLAETALANAEEIGGTP